MSSEWTAVLYGLASALTWGTGDFSGGLATRRSPVFVVVVLSQLVGAASLLVVIAVLGESLPAAPDFLMGGLAGLAGAVGLLAFYQGLSGGRMGVVAPLAAVVSAVAPVVAALILEGAPTPWQLTGFGVALTAVWIISQGHADGRIQLKELGLPLVAGLGFGFFFIFIDQVQGEAIFWPLVAARAASISVIGVLALVGRKWKRPSPNQMGVIALAGIFDTGGNGFFALAASVGRLDIAAVLS
ncbi:MAG: EamA family transporter, partial [Anaerolineae bacterium]